MPLMIMPQGNKRKLSNLHVEDLSFKCFNCRQLIFVITRQVYCQWNRLDNNELENPDTIVQVLADIFRNIVIQAPLNLIGLDGCCRRCHESLSDLKTEAFKKCLKTTFENKISCQEDVAVMGQRKISSWHTSSRRMMDNKMSGTAVTPSSNNYHRSSSTLRQQQIVVNNEPSSMMEDFVLSWKPRTPGCQSKQLASNNNNNNNNAWNGPLKERQSSSVYQTIVGPTVFPTKVQLQQPPQTQNPQNLGHLKPTTYCVTKLPQAVTSASDQQTFRFQQQHQDTSYNNFMAVRLRSMQQQSTMSTTNNAGPSTSTLQTKRSSPYAKLHQPDKKQGSRGIRTHDLQQYDSSPQAPTFPTNFSRVLRECPPPVPPALLRLPSAPLMRKDPASRLKVLLRVLPSIAGGSSSPDNCYLTVDGRKKQVALIEQQNQPRPAAIGASGAGTSKSGVPKVFAFDSVFSADDSQTEICSHALTEVAQSVVNGSDGCVLSFGHAGLGNANSMVGQDMGAHSLGIIPSAISWLFRLIQECKQRTGARFSIRVSAIEIAGPQEELRDLLVPYATTSVACASTAPVCLKEDPVFGIHLQNACELRVPTAEKAAFYFDAALAARRTNSEEDRRNSHLFFTLHVYQYQVDKCGKGGVAGGRTRLHLIDLGSGEKTSKSGRTSLTLPALGNVLLTLLQGQKHLPFRDSKLTQLLKDAIGSQACKAISVLTNVCPDQDRYMETVNAVQVAGRLCRIRRTKKTRLGLAGSTSSGGESSCDERSGRRRLPRSASDPDCTTSSSEQSCDTVIFLGAGGASNRNGCQTTISISDKELTDVESPPNLSSSQRLPLTLTTVKNQTPVMGTGRIVGSREPVTSLSSPQHINYQKSPRVYNSASVSQPLFHQQDSSKHSPAHWPGHSDLTASASAKEQWIDGPNLVMDSNHQPTAAEVWIDQQPKKRESPFLDPMKHEFIKQWVFLQEQELRQEIKLDNKASKTLMAPGAKLFKAGPFSPPQATADLEMASSEHSMETGSEPMDVAVETRDAAFQIDEHDIDLEMGCRVPGSAGGGSGLPEMEPSYSSLMWPSSTEPEIRFLEDIAEVEEENLSETRSTKSHHSSLHDQIMDCLTYRNEALAQMDFNFFAPEDQKRLSAIGRPSSSCIEEHPLRILSKERMDTKSDSFSFTSENIENISLPGTDQLEEDLPTDEELERAMQASLTSIRSHEILEKLKAESTSKKPNSTSQQVSESVLENFRASGGGKKLTTASKSIETSTPRLEPEGVEKATDKKLLEASQLKSPLKMEISLDPAAAAAMKTKEQQKMLNASLMSEKLHHPTVPALPKQVQNEVTSKFNAAAAIIHSRTPMGTKDSHNLPTKLIMTSSIKASKSSDKSEPLNGNVTLSCSSLPRPSKLPATAVPPKNIAVPPLAPASTKEPATSRLKFRSVKESKQPKPEKSNSKTTASGTKVSSGVTTNGTVGLDSLKPHIPGRGQIASSDLSSSEIKEKTSKSGKSTGIRSPLISFLKSPTKSKKSTVASPGQRTSIGYDSGHDSGIVTAESPELLASPYSKITKPRPSQRSSSGHGSDNSSAVSSDAGGGHSKLAGPKPKGTTTSSRLSLGFVSKQKNRESVGASSGYESGAGVRESETAATSPDSASDTENITLHSTPSCKFIRKKSWLESFTVSNVNKSKSAPQSPSNVSSNGTPYRMCDSHVVDRKEFYRHEENIRGLKRKQKEVASLTQKQATLQKELKEAKDRLGIPQSKWNYDLHVAQCTDLNQSDFLEALRQETKILEKRVIACKSHVLMVTVFDAVPTKKIA